MAAVRPSPATMLLGLLLGLLVGAWQLGASSARFADQAGPVTVTAETGTVDIVASDSTNVHLLTYETAGVGAGWSDQFEVVVTNNSTVEAPSNLVDVRLYVSAAALAAPFADLVEVAAHRDGQLVDTGSVTELAGHDGYDTPFGGSWFAAPGEQASYQFTLSLPADADNAAALQQVLLSMTVEARQVLGPGTPTGTADSGTDDGAIEASWSGDRTADSYDLRVTLLDGSTSAGDLDAEPVVAAAPAMSTASADPSSRDVIVVADGSVPSGRGLATMLEQAVGFTPRYVYDHAMRGAAGTVPAGQLNALQRLPGVADVIDDVPVAVQGQFAPDGVRRVFTHTNPAVPLAGDGAAVDADVAVLDTGIAAHADLTIAGAVDCVDATSTSLTCEPGGSDGHGHGTHVAGTIGARNNGSGIVGVAPGARLWAVRVLDDTGAGSASSVLAGIDWVTANAATIDVANLSLAGAATTFYDTAISSSVDAGVAYVVAAGNDAHDIALSAPAGHPDVLTVSALADYDGEPGGVGVHPQTYCQPEGALYAGADDTFATFSNFGAGQEQVDVIAPGVCVLSTGTAGNYSYMNGTSMAAPHVAGAAALLASNVDVLDRGVVDAMYDTIVATGNDGWDGSTDPDGSPEPLLDVSDALFGANGDGTFTGDASGTTPVDNDDGAIHVGANTSWTVTGLVPGGWYRVEVRARNAFGPGPWALLGEVAAAG